MMKRTFIPCSEWLYLKIYTGIKTADIVLEEAIKPLADYFYISNYISKWFFIRYNDPKPHLRVRFRVKDAENYSAILLEINQVLYDFAESGEISAVHIDTYKQEIERYGQNTIEEAESLFHKNSEFTLQCLHYEDEEKILVSLFYIDEILNKLGFSVQEKLAWIKDFNDAFKTEFKADKKLNSILDKKYRIFKTKYLEFLESEDFTGIRNSIVSIIEESSPELQKILFHHENQSLEISVQNFFQSIFHMNINRLFVSDQRVFEMVIYDYLMRYYKSLIFNIL
ncbi:thiopeptide-type bacteriocin biosynthesis protein [Chryseobacterium hispalense]|uniref:thiopeptide-type bacteriocin biosynthesis protein n=1 Tax=Chryseobacterium hispalense TaxID=1453492 RepID=UPI000493A98D|nr:thiopeptide-type bacteriocin biosynthesis protein [Chryseobacterium hispalense]